MYTNHFRPTTTTTRNNNNNNTMSSSNNNTTTTTSSATSGAGGGDGGPSDALIELLKPDGYYTYLGIPKPTTMTTTTTAETTTDNGSKNNNNNKNDPTTTTSLSTVDEDMVKRSYRKLSLRHHPDKRGGDIETFRRLNRAQTVLLNNKLRQEYDILGIDLDDDEEEEDDDDDDDEEEDDDDDDNDNDGSTDTTTPLNDDSSNDKKNHQKKKKKKERSSTSQKIIHEIASMALTNIIQLGFRTLMMAGVSLVLVRYRILLYPAILFLLYIFGRTVQQVYQNGYLTMSSRWTDIITLLLCNADIASSLFIAFGLLLMHYGKRTITTTTTLSTITTTTTTSMMMAQQANVDDDEDNGDNNNESSITSTTTSTTTEATWTIMFWMGEALVIAMFTNNSFPTMSLTSSYPLVFALATFSILSSLWFRGNIYNYGIVFGLEVFIGIFITVSFPIFELLLETILNDKLKKIGDKVRQHHIVLEEYYNNKKR